MLPRFQRKRKVQTKAVGAASAPKKKTVGKSETSCKTGVKKGQAKGAPAKTVSKKLTKEQEERKKKNKVIKFFLKWLLLLILLSASIIFFLMTPLFNIMQIDVIGNEKITDEEITSLSEIKLYENTFKINKREAIARIKENAYIDSVDLTRKLPDKLEITVKERVPTFILEFINGYVYMNNQGYLLEISNTMLELPILTGLKTPEEEMKPGNRLYLEDLEKLDAVLKVMDSANSNEIGYLITKINMEDEEEYILVFGTEEKIVYLGNGANIGDKMRYIKKMLEIEKGKAGEYYINKDIGGKYTYFRETM